MFESGQAVRLALTLEFWQAVDSTDHYRASSRDGVVDVTRCLTGSALKFI